MREIVQQGAKVRHVAMFVDENLNAALSRSKTNSIDYGSMVECVGENGNPLIMLRRRRDARRSQERADASHRHHQGHVRREPRRTKKAVLYI